MRIIVFVLAAFAPAFFAQSPPKITELSRVRLTSTRATFQSGEWVRVGFPVASSRLKSIEKRRPLNLYILDDKGAHVPAMFAWSGRSKRIWGPDKGPWIHATFATPSAQKSQNLRLVEIAGTPDFNSKTTIVGSPDFKLKPITELLPLLPGWRGENEPPLSEVKLSRDEVVMKLNRDKTELSEKLTIGPFVTGPLFGILASSRGEPLKRTPWTLHYSTTRIAASGTLYKFTHRSRGATCKVGPLRVDVLVHSATKAKQIIFDVRVVNEGPYGWGKDDAGTVYLDRLGLTLPVPKAFDSLTLADQTFPRDQLTDTLALIQSHQTGKKEQFPAELWKGDQRLSQFQKSPGYLAFTKGDDRLEIGVERFWQNAPKALAFRDGQLVLDLFPAGGNGPHFRGQYGRPGKKPRGEIDPASLKAYRFEGGRAKSFRIILQWGKVGTPGLKEGLDHPVVGLPIFEDLRKSDALGVPIASLVSTDQDRHRFERMMSLFVDDSVADPLPNIGRVGLPAFLKRGGTYGGRAGFGWFNFGDIPWGDGYCSLHYDLPYSVLTQAIRTGDARYFELGRDMARHRRDIDQDHSIDAQGVAKGGQVYEKGFWHGNFGTPKLSHTWVRGPLLHWQLTGDVWSLETALLNRHFIHQSNIGKWSGLYGARVPGWTLDNLAALYHAFGDPKDRILAEKIVKTIVERHEKGRGFMMNRAAKPPNHKPWMHAILAIGAARVGDSMGMDEGRDLARRLATFLETKALYDQEGRMGLYRYHDGKVGREPSTHLLWPLAAALAATGDPKAPHRQKTLDRIFRHAVRNHQGRSENHISFRMLGYPGSESKIMSNIALWGLGALPGLSSTPR